MIHDRTLHRGTYPECDVVVGFSFDDASLKATRVFGSATFLSTWQVTFRWIADGSILYGPATLTTTETSKDFNPQQQIPLSLDSEGALRVPVSVTVNQVA